MTEPAVASSDATNIATRIVRDGDEYVINGRKWWTSGAADPRCRLLIVMGKTDPEAASAPPADDGPRPHRHPRRRRQAVAPVFGRQDQHGHSEVVFTTSACPVEERARRGGWWLRRGAGPPRAGPDPPRDAGAGCGRARPRADGRSGPGARRVRQPARRAGVVRERIAESRIELEQARALCHRAAYVDRQRGQQGGPAPDRRGQGRGAPRGHRVIDRAIQVHGGAGVSDDTPLAAMWGWHRAMRIFDGPDEVHLASLARAELGRKPLFDL